MRRKPTPGFLALQAKLRENAILEAEEMEQKKVEKEMDNKAKENAAAGANIAQDKAKQKEQVQKEYAQFRYMVKSDILESVLSTIVRKSIPKGPDVINETNFINSIVREFVDEEGALDILNRMSTKTQLLSELALCIDEAYDDAVEEVDPKDPESFVANATPTASLIDKIEGDEEITDVTDIIKDKVSRATEEFIEKNVMDQQDIKDTLADTKEKIAAVKTGDDALDEEIREQYTLAGKKKVKQISNRPGSVFEQLVKNMASSVLGNDVMRESYTIDGKINMEQIVDKATCMYTLMEAMNTLKIKEFDAESIEKFISFE